MGPSSTGPAGKAPVVRRMPTLHDLVISDFQYMEAAGSDRVVLLWMQDAYTVQAMSERVAELVVFLREIAAEELSDAERWQRKVDFLSSITAEAYQSAKAGGAAGRAWRSVEQAYADAARTYYLSESALYGGQLCDLGAYLKGALEMGIAPDLERLAKEAFLSMARMSSLAGAARAVDGGRNDMAAQTIVGMMQEGVEAIHRVGKGMGGQANRIGRDMLAIVQDIGDDPEKYLDVPASPSHEGGLFDFDPEERGGGDEMDFAM